jgi:predicted AlkP superfamily phosphohydrolase/phosphomutase
MTSTPRRRVLILGLDGGTFDLIDPLIAAGKLPFLASLVGRGVSAPLRSVFPPKTIPAWYSFATGQDPGTLGIFGFTEPDGGPGKSRLVQTYRPHEALWDLLSRQGRRVGVVNFPLRNPSPVNGFFLPGMFSENPQTYPGELGKFLETDLGEPYLPELPPYRTAERARWMELAVRAVRQRANASESLIGRYNPEFLFVLFRETDRVEHQHWAELARPVSELSEDLLAFWGEVDRSCARIDAAFRASGGEAVTLVISDHGHGAAVADFFTNRFLLERGYLRFKNGGDSLRRRLVSRALMMLDRFPPARSILTPLADRLQVGQRGEHLAHVMTGDASFEAMAPKIDWEHTVAFSYPVPEAIYLNPYNPHLTDADRRNTVARLRRELEGYREARIEVFEPREIYEGVNHRQAPVLLLNVDQLKTESRMDFTYPGPMLPRRPAYFYGTGVHRMEGIFIAGGEGVPSVGRRSAAYSLLDVAPTVLEAMEIAIPGAMKGHSFLSDLVHVPG